jgi:hypothetical protein
MSIYEEVLSFMRSPEGRQFDALALEVFRHQFESIAPYRLYCMAAGRTPENVRAVDEVPFVSTVAFKYADLTDHANAGADALRFETSGTTEGAERRGRHVVARPEVYRESAVRHLRAMLFPDVERMTLVTLHPTAEVMPHSSLAQMLTWCIEEFGTELSRSFGGIDGPMLDDAAEYLEKAARRGEPVCLLGTTAAFAVLYDLLAGRGSATRQAPGSRMMDTGGPKGQRDPLSADEVIARAQELLGIAPEFAINEYGMTELCSQLYDVTSMNSRESSDGLPRSKLAPPWMRPYARDPRTLRPAADGDPGLLAFFDLANVGSVSAVMTEDIGVVERGRVRVLGRAGAADARGCALALTRFRAESGEVRELGPSRAAALAR